MKHLNRVIKSTSTFVSFFLIAISAISADEMSNGTQIDEPIVQIVGGSKAQKNEFPFMVALTKYGRSFCGASIINSTHVLTAAHCVQFFPQNIIAVVGALRLSNTASSQKITVDEIFVHPEYTGYHGEGNDIAVLRLSSSIRGKFTPINIAANSDSRPGKIATVAGWGDTSYGGNSSDILLKVNLPVVTLDKCRDAYGSSINNTMVCAGFLKKGGKDSCKGDSGGPLFIRKNNGFAQIGIVSFGTKCAEAGKPGVYTKVSKFIGFIKNKAGKVGFN